jgi:peptidoglycan/LPS O-acetylase OafA/YrhL
MQKSVGSFLAVSRPASSTKLDSLEIGRFVAASMVLFSHLPWFVQLFARSPQDTVFGGWVPPGPFAVQYFFTLSGFVMIMVHHRDFGTHGAPVGFWWRRACRIYPMYWLALLATLLCLKGPPKMVDLSKFITLAPVMVQNVVPPAWSLHVEMAFYVIFGFCLLPWIGRPLLGLWILTVLALCWRPDLQTWLHVPQLLETNAALYIFGTNYVFYHVQFFSGLLAGWLYLKVPLGRKVAAALLSAGVAALLACLPFLQWGHLYFLPGLAPGLAFGFGALILGMANLERSGGLQLGKYARRLGAMSYPLYILHSAIMTVFIKLAGGPLEAAGFRLGNAGSYEFLLASAAAIYAISAAIAFGVDQPLQRLLRGIGYTPAHPARPRFDAA